MPAPWPDPREIASYELEHDVAQQLAQQFVAKVIPTLGSMSSPPREITTVTAYDEEGRILSLEKVRVPAFDGRKHVNGETMKVWANTITNFAAFDEEHGTRVVPYLLLVSQALGRGGFVSRLKALAETQDADRFWSAVRYWHGSSQPALHKISVR